MRVDHLLQDDSVSSLETSKLGITMTPDNSRRRHINDMDFNIQGRVTSQVKEKVGIGITLVFFCLCVCGGGVEGRKASRTDESKE